MPIFCVKSVKIYTGQKNLHRYAGGSRDKYEVCPSMSCEIPLQFVSFVALVALEWPFPCVRLHMALQITILN